MAISISMLRKPEYFLVGAYALALLVLAFRFNGTGDDGDSLHHFLFAREAFRHPENFFNHWAKPLYVIFMAPWAQLGFVSVKLVNVALMALSMLITVQIARQMALRPAFFPLLFMVAAPISVYWVLSGLTEPMFVCWLIYGVFLAFRGRTAVAVAWLSFLPFVRSEGLVVLLVVAAYLLVKKRWREMAFLPLGHVALAIAGYPVHDDLLWVFNRIPYANLDSSSGYGVGDWTHYIDHFPEVYGWFIFRFLEAALIFGAYRLVQYWRGKQAFSKEEIWLVYGMFAAYFAAHTIFWAKGMFNSYGLMRVMLGIAPMIGLICARLAEMLLQIFSKQWQRAILATAYLILAAWGMQEGQRWGEQLQQNTSQGAHEALAEKYADTLRNGGYTLYFDAVHPAIALDVDIFGPKKRNSPRLFDGSFVPARSAVIWDHRYSVVDARTPLDKLRSDPRFHLVDSFPDGPTYGVYLFLTTDSFARYANVLLLEDFEKNTSEGVVAAPEGHSGKVLRLDPQHQYSRGLSAPTTDFKIRNKIRIQFDAWAREVPEHFAGLVVSYESAAGKILDYNFTPLGQWGMRPGKWQSLKREIAIKAADFQQAEVKIYLWNPSSEPLFLDNLKIEFADED